MKLFGGTSGDSDTITSLSGQEMFDVLKGMGFSPVLGTDSGGDPKVSFQVEGMRCSVFFYGVKEGRGTSLQFSIGFTDSGVPLDKVNEWNRTKRFLKVYKDTDGGVVGQMDVDLDGGVHRAYLEECVKRWRAVFFTFIRFLTQ